jgi:hypothetical protein
MNFCTRVNSLRNVHIIVPIVLQCYFEYGWGLKTANPASGAASGLVLYE